LVQVVVMPTIDVLRILVAAAAAYALVAEEVEVSVETELENGRSAAGKDRKVYSVGDLHGDFERFQEILTKTGLATFDSAGNAHWTGGDAVLISTGDTVDRGEHGRSIYIAFQELAKQAAEAGGEVVNIVGNHELMNLQGDLRYVAALEMSSGGEYGGRQQREQEWSRSGLIGADIRKRFVAAAVREGIAFVHGGLDPDVLRQYGSLEALNAKVRELLDDERVTFNHKLFGQKGPFWYRFLAEGPAEKACSLVRETLHFLGAKRMVVGHTPQESGVATRCSKADGDPQLILGDTIISRAYERSFGFSRPSAVEFSGNSVTALYFPENRDMPDRVVLHAGSSEL